MGPVLFRPPCQMAARQWDRQTDRQAAYPGHPDSQTPTSQVPRACVYTEQDERRRRQVKVYLGRPPRLCLLLHFDCVTGAESYYVGLRLRTSARLPVSQRNVQNTLK